MLIDVTTESEEVDLPPVSLWREAAGDYGPDGTFRSIADVTGPESLERVRAFKQARKQAARA